jgi:4-amino-4-deoxychorismate lyase
MTGWLVNGRADAMVAPDDRGLLYGDGLFETVAFHRGRSALWSLHMRRLQRGCAALGLPAPDEELLADDCARLVADAPKAVVRLALTRGRGGCGYFPPREADVTRIVLRRDWPADLERRRRDGVAMRTSEERLVPGFGAGLKHANRLAQVQIARELADAGADEALVRDPDGWIVEGLNANLVVVRANRLLAPGPHPAAVAGVGLAWLRQRAGADWSERPMRADELEPGDSIWVINSVTGPLPARCLDGRPLPRDAAIEDWQSAWRDEIES